MSFQKDFVWCVGGAAAQQDGGYLDGGKGLNIWDALSDGRVKNDDVCHVACDHFHKWKEDLQLLKELAKHRLEQAKENLEEAEILYNVKKYKGANNRAYYSIFG